MLQVRVKKILTGPQIAHGGSRCIWVGTQLVDHLREREAMIFFFNIFLYIKLNVILLEQKSFFFLQFLQTILMYYNSTM